MTPNEHWTKAEELLSMVQDARLSVEYRTILVKAARLHTTMAVEGLRLGFPQPGRQSSQFRYTLSDDIQDT